MPIVPLKAELQDTALPCQGRGWQAKGLSISKRHLGPLVDTGAQGSNWQLVLVGTDTRPLAAATSDWCVWGSLLPWMLWKWLEWALALQTSTAPAAQGLPKGCVFCRCAQCSSREPEIWNRARVGWEWLGHRSGQIIGVGSWGNKASTWVQALTYPNGRMPTEGRAGEIWIPLPGWDQGQWPGYPSVRDT